MSQRLALDSVAIRDERIFGWGWFLDDVTPAREIFLRFHGTDGSTRIVRCPQGGARPDLMTAFPHVPHAAGGGFMLQARVPRDLEVHTVDVLVHLLDGREHVEPLPQLALSLRERSDAAASIVTGDVQRHAWFHHLLAGRGREAWRCFRAGLRRRLAPFRSSIRQLRNASGHGAWVMFDHAMGGGANHFRQRKLAQWREGGHRVLLVTPVLASLEYEVTGTDGSRRFPDLQACLDALGACEHVAINNLVSFDDPVRIVQWTLDRKAEGARITYYLHDYHAACPSFTLTDRDHRHCGVPELAVCARCLPANDAPFVGMLPSLDVAAWRSSWGRLLEAADDLVAFSPASLKLLAKAFPRLDVSRVQLQPHSLDHLPQAPMPFRPDRGSVTTIGIVGAISTYKGAAIVRQMAELIEHEGVPARLVVIGTLDGAIASPALRVTGPYRQEELPALLAREEIGVAFLPSVVHETFSYVTAELMHHHVPLAVFDLGAPAERVREYPLGRVIPLVDARLALSELIDLHRTLPAGAHPNGVP